jgi:hypothetical protein
MNAWPSARKWLWTVLATLVVIAQGPIFLHSIRTTWDDGNDFFQDWSSARNVLEGRPAYLPLSTAVALYRPKVEGEHPPIPTLPWNAHPPTSVLASLPLALLGYLEAVTVWNLLGLVALSASLVLILRELKFPVAAWSILPIVTLGLLCGPIRTQVAYSQWNSQLLLSLTLAWVAERRGRDSWAGILVGIAVTLKLFPALFLLYYAIRRRWAAVFAGVVSVVVLTLVTVSVVGLAAYREYVKAVLPTLKEFRSGWVNASLPAFWMKNFATGAYYYGLYIEPLIEALLFAYGGAFLSYALLLATTFFYTSKFSTGCNNSKTKYLDYCYSLTMVAMLMLTPICWDHYLLLLALPLALVWERLGRSGLQRFAFLFLIAAVWVSPNELWKLGGVDILARWPDFQRVPSRTYVIHRPYFTLFFLSLHFYALVVLYVWLVLLARREIALSSLSTNPDTGSAAEIQDQSIAR